MRSAHSSQERWYGVVLRRVQAPRAPATGETRLGVHRRFPPTGPDMEVFGHIAVSTQRISAFPL